MKPATAFLLLALASGLGACQSQSFALASTSAQPSVVMQGELAARQPPLDRETTAPGAKAGQDAGYANLDDFYRDKLGIDPRILYAHAKDARGNASPAPQFGSAAGQ